MPVTTRSKRNLSSILEDVDSDLLIKESTTNKKPLNISTPNDPPQSLTAHPKPRRRQPKRKPERKPGRNSKNQPSFLTPSRQTHKQQNPGQEKLSKSTTISSPNVLSTITIHWPCRSCDCPRGIFESLIPTCTSCGHNMDDHELRWDNPWDVKIPFVCQRPHLVSSVLQLVKIMRVVAIRATPQVGKTTLLKLLGHHILLHQRDLEPVFIYWLSKEKRGNLTYTEFLEQSRVYFQKQNARYRPTNPNATPIYLIDEAQGSYDEEELWSVDLKNRDLRGRPKFVLVCLYGAAGFPHTHDPGIQSKALQMDNFQRVELRSSESGAPYMLFEPEETFHSVSRWAVENDIKLENINLDATAEYIHSATGGHPGMVGMVLFHYLDLCEKLPVDIRIAQKWSPALCHEIFVEHEGLLDYISKWGRGVWTKGAEDFTKQALHAPPYRHLKYFDVASALREVARKPRGHTRVRPKDGDIDALTFCYKMGFLHTEQPRPGSDEVTYIFASPIHQRIAYRRLIAGPIPGTNRDNLTLQQACLNAVERFSPSALHPRSSNPSGNWGIPEAAFQDEMYLCLNYELQNLSILSEYAHTKDGKIDFYLYDKKWGIETIQSGDTRALVEHATRFQPGGKYYEWGILGDYMILNFCSKSFIKSLEVKDINIHSHILHIAIDAKECTAEVYTYNKELLSTLHLGEGRQRSYSPEYNAAPEHAHMALRDQKILDKERMHHASLDKKEEMQRRIIELELQLNQR